MAQHSSPPSSPRILVVLPRQLGDILLGTPLAHALKERFPGARISWYAHPMGKLLLTEHPWVDELVTYPVPSKVPPRGPFSKLKAFCALARAEIAFVFSLRARRFTHVVDAMNNPRTALTSFLTGAPTRVSFRARFPRSLAFTHVVPRARLAQGYVAAARLALLEPLGVDASRASSDTLLPASGAERERVEAWLASAGVRDGGFIVLGAAHRHAVRKWPGDRFVALCARIFERHGLVSVWLWGPGEDAEIRALHAALAERVGQGASAFPPLFSLRETAHLSGLSRGFVGNSNGLSHVAVAGGAPSVQLHGPTNPANWTHPDALRHAGVQRQVGCVRCDKNTCALARRECLEDLSMEDVLAAFERIDARVQ